MTSTPSVYEFTNYRSFLRAHAEDRRTQSRRWSLGTWAKQLKLGATTSLTMILNGQRNPGPQITQRLSHYFKFNKDEKKYFEDLVRLEKSKSDPRVRALLLEALSERSAKGTTQFLDHSTFEAISRWEHYCIRQLSRMESFDPDPFWIKEHLLYPVSIDQIRRAIRTLKKLNVLIDDPKTGKLRTTGKPLRIDDDLQLEAVRRFHKQVIELAIQSIESVHFEERELQAYTFSFKKSRLPEIKEKIRVHMQSLSDQFGEDDGDAVYQLNLQFFPLALSDLKKRKKPVSLERKKNEN